MEIQRECPNHFFTGGFWVARMKGRADAWAAVAPFGSVLIARTRTAARQGIEQQYGCPWASLKRRGWRLVAIHLGNLGGGAK